MVSPKKRGGTHPPKSQWPWYKVSEHTCEVFRKKPVQVNNSTKYYIQSFSWIALDWPASGC